MQEWLPRLRFFQCGLITLFFVSLMFDGVSSRTQPKKKAHHFEYDDPVPFWANKVGPIANPSETYEYYSLPYCPPTTGSKHHHASLSQDLVGDHKQDVRYDAHFRVNMNYVPLCEVELSRDDVKKFRKAIERNYYWELLYDENLPITGDVGVATHEPRSGEAVRSYFLYKHFNFLFLYNNDQVIFANASADATKTVELPDDESVSFTFSYSATWIETDTPFKDRMTLYRDRDRPEMEIHWLSIINSCVLVLLLTGFLAIILMRVLKSDYTRYDKTQEDDEDDYGWKLIHGDVFRFPPQKNLFTAFVGLGAQCLAVFFALLTLSLFNIFYPNSGGSIYVAVIVLYALTTVLGGFVSARLFRQMEGEKWAWNVILSATLFTVPCFLVFSYANTVAIAYKATAAVPIESILLILVILLLVAFPLNVIGGIAGKRSAGPFEAPCRTKKITREIPAIPLYRALPAQMLMAGFLPFSAIYIELFYVFSAVWGQSSYQLFYILFLVGIILVVVTACITVALTYFQLSMEDHRWWWSSFLNGGSTGIFIYGYSIFYYIYRSEMSGFLQASFYFTYMAVLCYFFFVMLGTVGFYSSLFFIKKIYQGLHVE